MTLVGQVTLRAERPEDRPLLQALYAETRTVELADVPWTDEQKRAFCDMQFDLQARYYRQTYPDAQYDVIEMDGAPVGRLYVARLHNELRVLDVALIPALRGHGLGATLMHELMGEARSAGKPLRLSVETYNPAQRLYQRLGFAAYEQTDFYLHMEWHPAAEVALRG